ncbi:hypothetical protein ACEPAI_6205 [Sanghuangporus weigelae]
MNIDDGPLVRHSGHSRSNRLSPSDIQESETHSFPRLLKTKSISSRSPFSKFVISSNDSRTPVQRLETQGQNYLGRYDSTSRCGATGIVPSEFEQLSTSSGRDSVNCARLPLNQACQPAAAIRQPNTIGNEPFRCKPEIGNFSEETIDDANVYACDSSVEPQTFQQSFKKESDVFAPDFLSHSSARQISETQYISALVPQKPSAYYPATPNLNEVSRGRNNTEQPRAAGRSFPVRDSRTERKASISRESSMPPFAKEQSGDDLSTLLFKGATDVRNTNMALEEKTKALVRLEEELSAAVSEKNNLSKQLSSVKARAKDGLESHAKKLEKMNEDLRSLVIQSQEFSTLVRQAKASMTDVTELKDIVKKSTDQLGTLVDHNGVYAPTQVWKSILGELQTEMSNKQQVIDMFRDRLELVQGDLAEAKNRIMELEGIQVQNSGSLQSSSQQLGDSGKKIIELTSLLRDQQRENTIILTKNIELENRTSVLTERNVELETQISCKEAETESLAALNKEYEALRKLLADRDEQIKVLHDIKDRFIRTEELLNDRELKLHSLTVSAEAKDKSIVTLRKSLSLAEANVAKEASLSQCLKKDLDFSRAQLRSEYEIKTKLLDENNAIAAHEKALVAEASKIKGDLEESRIKLQQSHTRCESLQERFEEQAMMLQLEKKAHGDVQERLASAEAMFSETIEKLTRNSACQMNELKAQISKLEGMLSNRHAELSAKTQEYSRTLSDIEAIHAESIHETEKKLAARSEEVKMLNQEAEELKEDAASLRIQLESLRSDYGNLQLQLSQAREPSEAHAEEIVQLKRDIEHLRKANDEQAHRAGSILSRYEKGDLSIEEKKLVDAAHKACQTAHEQQLVVTGNEIRQRDNLIKSLETRKSELESQLARVLNTQASTKAVRPASEERGRSLIDLDGWESSQASTSPIDRKGTLTARERDRLTTKEVDFQAQKLVTPTARSHKINVSPPAALSFAKLSEQTTELLDKDDIFDENTASTNATVPKRKRAPDTVVAEEREISGPPRRSKTGTRTRSRTTNNTEVETTLSGSHSGLSDEICSIAGLHSCTKGQSQKTSVTEFIGRKQRVAQWSALPRTLLLVINIHASMQTGFVT